MHSLTPAIFFYFGNCRESHKKVIYIENGVTSKKATPFLLFLPVYNFFFAGTIYPYNALLRGYLRPVSISIQSPGKPITRFIKIQ